MDQTLVPVGKWVLLAAGKKDINRERQHLDSSLTCAVTILGHVAKETDLTSCVYSCFSHEICKGSTESGPGICISLRSPYRAAPVTQHRWGLVWASFLAVQTLHQWLLQFIEEFLPTESHCSPASSLKLIKGEKCHCAQCFLLTAT